MMTYVDLDIVGVRLEVPMADPQPMLLFKESAGERYLPVWIGAHEAAIIMSILEGETVRATSTAGLLAHVLRERAEDISGRICDYREGIFAAELCVGGHVFEARPSDLAAQALLIGFPLSCPSWLMDKVGVEPLGDTEDEVEAFRQFLDTVDPEDFNT